MGDSGMRTLLVFFVLGCGASTTPTPSTPEPESTPQDEAQSEDPLPSPATDDDGAWRLEDDDDAVTEWSAASTHDDATNAFRELWRAGFELADDARWMNAATAAIEDAARAARDPERRSDAESPPETHPTLETLVDVLQHAEGVSAPNISLEGTGAGNSWIVHGVLASHLVRTMLPLVVDPQSAALLQSLQPLGDPYGQELRYVEAIERLRPLAVATGEPPRRQFSDTNINFVLWRALDVVHMSLFAAEEDVSMVPDTAPGWCIYARWLAYEHWTDLSEQIYWSGEEIDTQLMALQEGDSEAGELTEEQLRSIRQDWQRTEPHAYAQRRLTISGSADEIDAGLERALPAVEAAAPVIHGGLFEPPIIRSVALRRAQTIRTRCE